MKTTLQARPVVRSFSPMYPTRLAVEDLPRLLSAHQPPSWLGRREMAGAMAALLAVSTPGCSKKDHFAGAKATDREKNTTSKKTEPIAAIVAPIFAHGEGTGALGCVVVSPPVFLPEDEAIALIREELEKAGLSISDTNVPIQSVQISPKVWEQGVDWETGENTYGIVEKPPKALEVDLMDSDRRVAVEYVCQEDNDELGGEPGFQGTTVSSWNLKATATQLKTRVETDGEDVRMGLFYDPVEGHKREAYAKKMDELLKRDGEKKDNHFSEAWKMVERDAQARSKELLRAQVTDFVEWLKGQGVI